MSTTGRLRSAEVENETFQRQLREAEYTIQDLEQKLESNLEQLALIQWELEEYRMHTQEQIERLNQQRREAETELAVKENELKRVRYQQAQRSSGKHQKAKRSLTQFHELISNTGSGDNG